VNIKMNKPSIQSSQGLPLSDLLLWLGEPDPWLLATDVILCALLKVEGIDNPEPLVAEELLAAGVELEE
jgi:hypothetical protein